MGWQDPVDWHEWTDSANSGYVEMHGGLMPTYDEWYTLEPGGYVNLERDLVSGGGNWRDGAGRAARPR